MYPLKRPVHSSTQSNHSASISNLLLPGNPSDSGPEPQSPSHLPAVPASLHLRPIQAPLFSQTPTRPLTPLSTPFRTPTRPDQSPQRLLENVYYALEDAHRNTRELQDLVVTLRHENQLLRQENYALNVQLKNVMEKGQGASEPLDARRVDLVMSRYVPAIQNALSETMTRAMNEIRADLIKD